MVPASLDNRGATVVCLHLAHLLSPLGSGICKTPLVDRQNLATTALSHLILEFNAFNASHMAKFFLSIVGRSLEFVAFKNYWQRTWN